MSWLYLVSCWLHVMAAVVWLGAAIFLVVAVVPALRNPQLAGVSGLLVRSVTKPLRWVGAGALGTFLVTGFYNLHVRFGAALGDPDFWSSRLGKAIGLKLAIFGVVVLVAVVHDLWLGPRAARAGLEDPDSEATQKLRRGARFCGRLNLVLGLIMVGLGILIVRPGW